MVKRIEGQVAGILNERELAINRGGKHGVEPDMRFMVLEPEGVPITDPETGEQLGLETPIKIRVKVFRVEDDYSLARTYERLGGADPLNFGVAALLHRSPPRVRTLRTSEALFPPLTEEESYVKRGDPVRQIVESEEDS
jgi:hypothetical protein